jgi:hypothetical protein
MKGRLAMIKGKRKNLSPEENLESILDANVGLPNWRVKTRRPRRRVAIAYRGRDERGRDLWAEFEWRRGVFTDAHGQVKLGVIVTYNRSREKPKCGFIADGRDYSIRRPNKDIVRVSYQFPEKKINVPDDIVTAFRKVWYINIPVDFIAQAYDKWKKENDPQQR